MSILLIFILLFSPFQPIKQVSAESNFYAQVLLSECYLFKTPTDNTSYTNIYFMIEPTYFVQLLSNYDDNFYKAKYMDKIGYVKKSQVQCVDGVPQNPYLNNISFRVYSNISREMQNIPYCNLNSPSLVEYLPMYCDDLIYYGKVYGESAIQERTNIWYYCKYTITGQTGYVYSDACDQMSTIVKNTEKLPFIDEPVWKTEIVESNQLIKVDSNPYKLTVILICIPFALFALLLIKFAFTKKTNKKEVDIFNPFE